MKKLALGLLLTAGICGNAWASEGKTGIKKTNNEGCTIYALIKIKDSCGKQVGTTSTVPHATGKDCEGAQMNMLFPVYETTVPGCASTPEKPNQSIN